KMIAKEKKKEECFNWLKEREVISMTDKLFYEEVNGKIVTVAGLIVCMGEEYMFAQIEPMKSENIFSSHRVYNEIIEYLKKFKIKYVLASSSNEKVFRALKGLGW